MGKKSESKLRIWTIDNIYFFASFWQIFEPNRAAFDNHIVIKNG
jgi:hypothetical protein